MKKKVLLTLMAFTLIATSCKKYDDDFRDLNARIDALAAQVQGVNTLVAGILSTQVTLAQLNAAIATIPNPTAAIATLTANLATLTGTVGSIQTALGILATSFTTQTGITNPAIASLTAAVALLQGQLIAVNASLATLLAANNVYDGSLIIHSAAALDFALALGSRVAIVNGAVSIGVVALDATKLATLNGRILTTTGAYSYDASTSGATPTVALQSVGGAFTFTGTNAVTFPALTSVAGITTINARSTSILGFPVLASTGGLTITQDETSNATRLASLAFPALRDAGTITTLGVANQISFTRVTSISLPALRTFTGGLTVSGALLTSFSAPALTALVAGNALTISGTGIILTTVDLGSLVTSVPSISIIGEGINSLNLTALQSVGTVTPSVISTLTLQSNVLASYSLAALTRVTGVFDIGPTAGTATPTVSLTVLALSGNLTIRRAITILLPALASTGVILTFPQATTIFAPLTRINLATPELVAGAVTNLTIGTNADVVTANIPAAVTVLSLNGTGGTNPDATLTAGSFTSISFTGAFDDVALSGIATTTTVSTLGTMESFSVTGLTGMTALTLGHTHLLTSTAGHSVTVTGNINVSFTSLTLGQDFVRELIITGNTRLATLSLASMVNRPFGITSFIFNISGNWATTPGTGMLGTYSLAGAGAQVFTQAGLASGRTYMLGASGAGFTTTISLNYATAGTAPNYVAPSAGTSQIDDRVELLQLTP